MDVAGPRSPRTVASTDCTPSNAERVTMMMCKAELKGESLTCQN